MKGRVLAVETGPVLRRAAIVENGRLDAIEIDRPCETCPLPGAIHRCRVTGLLTGIGAATLDLGDGMKGFLPEAGDLAPGDTLLAEVRREAENGKEARLSEAISLRDGPLVFTPMRPGINISRRIVDEAERTRLRAALMPFADRGGFVIRTAAQGADAEDLRSTADTLVARYDALAHDAAPGLRVPSPDCVARILDGARSVDAAMADEASLPLLPHDPVPRYDPAPFEALDIDGALSALLSPRHDLSEGWVSVDPTPALVAIDVNTGGATPLGVNLDVARMLPRLLSLKKLGGLVLVDFAGGPKGRDRVRIAEALRTAAAHYLVEARVAGWTPTGLLEMVCRRPGRSLAELLSEDGP